MEKTTVHEKNNYLGGDMVWCWLLSSLSVTVVANHMISTKNVSSYQQKKKGTDSVVVGGSMWLQEQATRQLE
jgi:hypothetical protein